LLESERITDDAGISRIDATQRITTFQPGRKKIFIIPLLVLVNPRGILPLLTAFIVNTLVTLQSLPAKARRMGERREIFCAPQKMGTEFPADFDFKAELGRRKNIYDS